MQTFPLLASGAIIQYPAGMTSAQGAQVIRFLDGSDQRYLTQGRTLRQWQIRLDLLNELEMQQMEEFFAALQGDYSTFVFPDPISESSVPNCRLAASGLASLYTGVDKGAISLQVIETYG